MFISSSLQPSTGGTRSGCFPEQRLNFGLTFRRGSLRQAIMYRQYPFSEQKQREAKVKVKETDPTDLARPCSTDS